MKEKLISFCIKETEEEEEEVYQSEIPIFDFSFSARIWPYMGILLAP